MTGSPAVKICGVCSPEDAALATLAGAAYVGVVLVPGRARSRKLAEAAAIFSQVSCSRVGVFVDPSSREVAAAVSGLALDVVQLHGGESPALAHEIAAAIAADRSVRLWKAVHVRSPVDVPAAASAYAGVADGLLLEGWSEAGQGGVGAQFDWAAAADARDALPAGMTLVVAGGLRPDNVAAAVRLLRPDVVDVSSGVEEALCRKSAGLVNAFVAAARAVVV